MTDQSKLEIAMLYVLPLSQEVSFHNRALDPYQHQNTSCVFSLTGGVFCLVLASGGPIKTQAG